MRVVVVGGGLVGWSVALSLKERGVDDVHVLEKAIPGAEASTAAAGILSPQVEAHEDGPFLRLAVAGALETMNRVQSLHAHTGNDCGYLPCGTLALAFHDEDVLELQARVLWQTLLGLRAEWLPHDVVRERVPGVHGDVRGGAFFPDDHQLQPRLYLDALVQRARALGVTSTLGQSVRSFITHNNMCTGVLLDNESTVHADAVALCAGAWSTKVPGTGLGDDDVHPVRGQVLEVRQPHATFSPVLYARGGYLVPRADGRVVCGATMERTGYAKDVTAGALMELLHIVTTTIPTLKGASFSSTWCGLRPGTSDGLPVLGESAVRGLWLATGHFRNGVLLAAVSGEELAKAMLGEEPGLDLAPFSPLRFAR
jgi:glycine oxidase